jgi:hypothetical protein
VRYLAEEGFAHVERRALTGNQDRGDIAGIPGVVIEAKNCARTELAQWVDEAAIEQANDGADYAAVWHHRRGKAHPADGFVTVTGAMFVRLLRSAGYGGPVEVAAEVTHLVRPGGGSMDCCGRTPFELPRTDRMTVDRIAATCTGGK